MAILTNKYYDVFGTIDGEQEQLFGSFNRQDCKDELDAERETWKDQGYKKLTIVSRITDDKPDLEVYKDEYLQDAIQSQENTFNDVVDCPDLELVDTINGIDYYHSGDEFDFITATDRSNEVAIYTEFLEMDDFYPIETSQGDQISDYAIVNNNGLLMCLFECEGFHASKLSNNDFYLTVNKIKVVLNSGDIKAIEDLTFKQAIEKADNYNWGQFHPDIEITFFDSNNNQLEPTFNTNNHVIGFELKK